MVKSSHAKALVFQLGPNKLNQFATKELHEFDLRMVWLGKLSSQAKLHVGQQINCFGILFLANG